MTYLSSHFQKMHMEGRTPMQTHRKCYLEIKSIKIHHFLNGEWQILHIRTNKWLVGMALDHWCDFYNLSINYAFYCWYDNNYKDLIIVSNNNSKLFLIAEINWSVYKFVLQGQVLYSLHSLYSLHHHNQAAQPEKWKWCTHSEGAADTKTYQIATKPYQSINMGKVQILKHCWVLAYLATWSALPPTRVLGVIHITENRLLIHRPKNP